MTQPDKAETVRALFRAFMSGDRAAADALLADDFRFTSPYDNAIDKATYFERCWAQHGLFVSHTVELVMTRGDVALARYRCTLRDGKEFRNMECFTFANGLIRSVEVFFGATYYDGEFVKAQPN